MVPRFVRAAVERPATEGAAAPAGTPLAVAVAVLVEDTFRLVRTLVAAPFRLADALRKLVIA